MKRIINYIMENTWTWVGTGMVLITLSGPTLRQALMLTGIGIVLHSLISLTQKDSE
jgi:hypothetical protein